MRLLRAKNPELIESPRAYLYRIAIHVLDEWRSKERRARLHSNKGLDTLVAKSDAFDDPERRDVAVDLRQALATLPVRYGTTLVLRWHHGMSYKEIAAHLDVTERMVKRYIVKGYAKLRTHLDTEGGK